MKRVIIFDTTLRDGEQSPGASLTSSQKLIVARQLENLGVDVIEAGFAISSPDDFKSIQSVSSALRKTTICSLSRCVEKDILAAADALKPAKKKRIHVFIATSPVHMKYKLKMTPGEVVETAVKSVKLAKKHCDEVEFSCEDATRSDKKFLVKVLEKVIKAGAKIINLPDTVGYSYPEETGKFFKYIIENVKGSHRVIFSAHCHNDLGLATANSLSAILNGVRQVECTINGIGERAGNASLEEIVMALKVRFPEFKTGVNTKQILRTSRLISTLTGIFVQPNKAIVGANAFAHEAGIHQDGVLKKAQTYEIMRPQDIGAAQSVLILGKHSGRAALKRKIEELGFRLNEEQLNKVFRDFKKLADKKKKIFDDDIVALMGKEFTKKTAWQLLYFDVKTSSKGAQAEVHLEKNGKKFRGKAKGDGPVDSVLKAVDSVTKTKGKLIDYSVNAITMGKDAQGEVRLTVEINKKRFFGSSSSTDIIEASILAYLSALTKYKLRDFRKMRQSL